MTTIVTRAGKGSALTFSEADANFTNLNNDKLEVSAYTQHKITEGNSTVEVDDTGTGSIIYTVDGVTQALMSSAVLSFSPASYRLQGDFSNATVSSRMLLQTSTSNGATNVGIVPNGTARISAVTVFNDASPVDTEFGQLYVSDTEVAIKSSKINSGVSVPLNFHVDGTIRMSISTAGVVTVHSGSFEVESGSGGANAVIDGATSNSKSLLFQTAGSNRWQILSNNTAESSTSSGSDFNISRYNNSGVYIDIPFLINRTNGYVQATNGFLIATSRTPASAAATGTAGEICWDSNYIYVCVATDTWKRVAIATW